MIGLLLLGGDGEFKRAVGIFDAKALHRVRHQGGNQGDAGGGFCYRRWETLGYGICNTVAEEIGDTIIGIGAGRNGHREGAGVDLLHLIEEADELAFGGTVELAQGIFLFVDGDYGFVRSLDVLVRGDGDGHQVAALVGPRRGADGEVGGGLVVYQGDAGVADISGGTQYVVYLSGIVIGIRGILVVIYIKDDGEIVDHIVWVRLAVKRVERNGLGCAIGCGRQVDWEVVP